MCELPCPALRPELKDGPELSLMCLTARGSEDHGRGPLTLPPVHASGAVTARDTYARDAREALRPPSRDAILQSFLEYDLGTITPRRPRAPRHARAHERTCPIRPARIASISPLLLSRACQWL